MAETDNREKESFFAFDDAAKEVVFFRHDMPSPWMNYLTNGKLFTMISQAGGNLSWYKSPEIWRIGKYNFYNLPVDVSGAFLYLKDCLTGKTWNPTVIPTDEKPDAWESRHGLGYTRFEAEKDGLRISLTFFIGADDVLIFHIKIKSDKRRKVQLFACQEMGLMQYLREVQWQCYVKNSNDILYDEATNALVYRYFPDGQPRPEETPNVFFCSDIKLSSFSGCRSDFIGCYRDYKNPIAVERGSCGNRELRGGEAMFSLSFDLELKENEEQTLNLFLGTKGQKEELCAVTAKLREQGYVERSFDSLKDFWERRLAVFQAEIPDTESARMMNIWNPLQAYINFLVCREISFYATGTVRGVGVRDAAQDALGNVIYDIGAAKQKVKLVLEQQYRSGKTNHYFYPEERTPSLVSDRSDNHLWIIYTVYQIVMESGETDFLKEEVPYFDGGSASVFGHLVAAADFTLNHLGENGLPLMLGSDWNDMLSNVGKEGRGESVFVSQMLVLACRELSELCRLTGRDGSRYENAAATQIKILNEACWDGDWFIRAVTDDGVKLGKKTDECARIWINSQSWAVISDSTDEERARRAMESAEKLLDCGYGWMKLYPPLRRNYPSPQSELTFAQPGIGENGGVFCHANAWAIIAECMLKNGEQAYALYRDLLPERIIEKFGVDLYRAEPYVYSSNIRSPMALNAGEAGVSWLTGTAAWMLLAVQEHILGIKPVFKGLKISPCIPNAWRFARVRRLFRGCEYTVEIDNSAHCGNRVKEIFVDGVLHNGSVIVPNGEKLFVRVVMG